MSNCGRKIRAGIFKKSMGARHRGGIGFSYRPARLDRLAEFIPWNQFRGPINIQKYGLLSPNFKKAKFLARLLLSLIRYHGSLPLANIFLSARLLELITI